MNVVFFGTPDFAVPTLEKLVASRHEVVLVVSRPDRPVGRHQVLTAPPVIEAAQAFDVTFGIAIGIAFAIDGNSTVPIFRYR